MKTIIIANLLLISCLIQSVGQNNVKNLPVIDMHVHVYTPQNYWGGFEFSVVDTILSSPADQEAHLEALIQQMKKYNIVKTYASGNFEALSTIFAHDKHFLAAMPAYMHDCTGNRHRLVHITIGICQQILHSHFNSSSLVGI